MYLQRLDEPTDRPAEVTKGYKRQNRNMVAARLGLDTTNPFERHSNIIIPVGGVVEVCGIMYCVTSEKSMPKEVADRAYWIVVVPSPDSSTADFELVERPGVWLPDRQGCYFTNDAQRHNNRRTLNWVSRGTLASIPDATERVYHHTTKISSDIISLQRGWYFVSLGSGFGGRDGANGSDANNENGGAGSQANFRNLLNLIFFSDKPFYQVRIGGDGQSGADGTDGDTRGQAFSGGGGGGGCGAGEEIVFDGISTGNVPAGEGGFGRINSNSPSLPNPGESGDGWNGGRGGHGGSIGGSNWELVPGRGGRGGWSGHRQPEGAPGGFCSVCALGN